MKAEFLHVLQQHPAATANPSLQEALGQYVRHTLTSSLVSDSKIDKRKYDVKASVGMGNWAEIPWVAIFNRSITTTAQRGYYIVYLFRKDMTGFYLSLNQGWTFFENTYKGKLGKEKIRIVSQAWRNRLSSFGEEFGVSAIDLKCKGSLGVGYELGHICGKFYSTDDIPDDLTLVNDLRALIGVYSELKGHIGKLDVDKYTQLLASESNILPLIEQEEEEAFSNQVLKAPPSSTPEEPQSKPGSFNSGGRSNWVRNPEKAAEALSLATHRCEVDPSHNTFISASSGNNFVEAHHLIPMRLQANFTYSLDVPGNIVSLCPNCHRAIHHAVKDVRANVITNLFERRKDKLDKFGISMPLADLIKQY